MCGIFALFINDTKSVSEEIIKRNFDKIQYRGPDNSKLEHIVNTPNLNVPKSQQPCVQHQWYGFHRLAINGLNPESDQPLVEDDVMLILASSDLEIVNSSLGEAVPMPTLPVDDT